MRPRIITTTTALILLCACAQRPGEVSVSPTPRPAPHANAATVAPTVEEKSEANGAGKFNEYAFTFERKGSEATATFRPRLPWRDSAVVGAAREVILAAYGEKLEGFARPASWTHEGQSVQAIKLGGNNNDYVFWPVKDESGAVQKIFFRRAAKDSVR